MHDNPQVSVIIPIYNTALYLEECLDSIINQTLESIEIICINDGSTDDSLNILLDYANRDNRIQIYAQCNRGLSAARNKGLEMANSPYIYFMDSDDILDLDALSYLFHEASTENLDIVYFDGNVFYETPELEAKFPNEKTIYSYQRNTELNRIYRGYELLSEFCRIKSYRAPVWIQFYSHSFLIRNNLNFYDGIIHEDELFTFTCMLCANRVSHRQKAFFRRRLRKNSIVTVPISMKNVRGVIICYINMLLCFQNANIPLEFHVPIQSILNGLRKTILNKMRIVFSREHEFSGIQLTSQEQSLLMEIIYKDIVRLEQKISTQQKNLILIKEELQVKDYQLNLYQKQLQEKEQIQANLEIQIRNLNHQCINLQKSLTAIKNSNSYRYGRMVIFFPKKILGGLRCCKDHGFLYTCKLFVQKLRRAIFS